MNTKKLSPVHPGTVLKYQLAKIKLTQAELARSIKVSTKRINEICQGQRAITFDTACRLSVYLGTSAELWWNLQRDYEMECLAEQKKTILSQLKKVIKPYFA